MRTAASVGCIAENPQQIAIMIVVKILMILIVNVFMLLAAYVINGIIESNENMVTS